MDTPQLWQALLGELELNLSKANFITWFQNTNISSIQNGRVVINVPNAFTQSWLEKKYHSFILKALQKITNYEIKEVIYKIENTYNRNTQPAQSNTPQNTYNNIMPAQSPQFINTPAEIKTYGEFTINPKYNFTNFIVGKSNALAHAACVAISEKPGMAYNPLFIYGGVGLGKTHLLHAVGNQLISQNPNTKLLYASCEKFTNDYINMVKTGKGKEFQDIYRNTDVLLIDDIQFITGKEGTQEAFFHTFNELHQKNKQIIITSDRPPKAIPTLEQRLISRFEWGMIADIQNPDLETRIAILQAKCGEKRMCLDKDVINYIATNIQSNIRELEGALNRLLAHHQLQQIPITLESTKNILTNLTAANTLKKSLTPKQILTTVAQFYDIALEDILGNCRKRELVIPRQIVMFLMRQEIQSSFPSIGEELGGRDHTTAIHAYEKMKNEMENNEKIKQDVTLIKQRLYNVC